MQTSQDESSSKRAEPDVEDLPVGYPESLRLAARERTRMPGLSPVEALAEGFLVDVSEEAGRAGYLLPVHVTRALWRDMEAVPDALLNRNYGGVIQTPPNRLWHLLVDVAYQVRRDAAPGDTAFLGRVTLPTQDGAGRIYPQAIVRYALLRAESGDAPAALGVPVVAILHRPGEADYLPGSAGETPLPLSQLPQEAILVIDSQDVAAVRSSLGITAANADEFDAFALLIGDGDYRAVWGFNGFPYAWKSAYPLLQQGRPTERLQSLQAERGTSYRPWQI